MRNKFLPIIPLLLVGFMSVGQVEVQEAVLETSSWWEVQSIDTVKFSRDLAWERLNDDSFNQIIEAQVKEIASVGATHIALGTPYDGEFIPFLKKWVRQARKNDLKIWFRGNWAGWEGWFDYPPLTREEHIEKTRQFILLNQDLFEDGDIFTSCTECENGGEISPFQDPVGHRLFLIREYLAAKDAFEKIGRSVTTNYFSMNFDVASLIMDRETTTALDGVVVIDHYVATPELLIAGLEEIATQSGGRVVLGEFGVPIPDIHGEMTEEEQARWLSQALASLSRNGSLIGVNYWVSRGGSSELWSQEGKPRSAVWELAKYYQPQTLEGEVRNEIGWPIKGALVSLDGRSVVTGAEGQFKLAYVPTSGRKIFVEAQGYLQQEQNFNFSQRKIDLVLQKSHENFFFRAAKLFVSLIAGFSDRLSLSDLDAVF